MTGSLWDAALLGLVEGLTEFIPVSSTGHLIITERYLHRESASADVFDVFIQIGAILAVVWVEWRRLFNMAIGMFTDSTQRMMVAKVIVAFLPAALLGILLLGFIKRALFSPWIVGITLIIGGIVMLLVERAKPQARIGTMESMPLKTALGIGLCQTLALIPGVSRSGASIVGALLLGVDRRAATEFSFLLAIPTICGAAVYDLYKSFNILSAGDLPIFTVGTVTAFLSAFIVVKTLIGFVSRHGFAPFGYYRIGFGALVIVLLMTGWL